MTMSRLLSSIAIAATVLLANGCADSRGGGSSNSCGVACPSGTVCNAFGRCVPVAGTDAGSGGGGGTVVGGGGGGGGTGVDAGTGGGGGGGTGVDAGTGGGGGGTGGTNYCGACTSDADCGGGGNFCLAFSFGNYCGSDCSSGQTCPGTARCVAISDGSGNTVGNNCVPQSGDSCTSTGGGGVGGTDAGTGGGGGTDAGTGGGGGSTGAYCGACSSDADCGGGNNFCLAFSFGNYCGTDCSAGQTCPSGAYCAGIGDSSGATIGQNCVPNSGTTCSGGSTGGGGGGTPDAGTGGGGGSCTSDTYSGWAGTFFSNHCNRGGCHGSSEFTASDCRSRTSTIASYISSGSMPRGETLSSSDRSRILTWLNCGAP